ncbi:MAG: citrate/2-methylcitrate synthase, partial [Pirellulaceae bacterium]|nr:citrate/2-methylcitrate synthase [Pirellulaceae bacterium]
GPKPTTHKSDITPVMICLLGMIFNLIFVSGLPWQYFAIRAESLCKGTPAENLYETLQALEIEFNAEMQARGKDLWANVEYYKGAVFVALGIPADNFTALFAMARSIVRKQCKNINETCGES